MNLRSLHQAIATQQAEIERLTSNVEALDHTASGMPPADREKAHATAAKIRTQIQAAIIKLHELQALLPQTENAADWAGSFPMHDEPVRLPPEMAHLWGAGDYFETLKMAAA